MDILPQLLAAFGLCFGLMNDKLPGVAWVRARWAFADRMLECAFCTGFHCGWLVWGLGVLTHTEMPPSFVGSVAEAARWALASSATCYLLDTFAQWLEKAAQPDGE